MGCGDHLSNDVWLRGASDERRALQQPRRADRCRCAFLDLRVARAARTTTSDDRARNARGSILKLTAAGVYLGSGSRRQGEDYVGLRKNRWWAAGHRHSELAMDHCSFVGWHAD